VRVWALLQEPEPRTVQNLCDVLLAEFDVSSERCEREVRELAQALAEAGLVEIRDPGAH
jgi:Coenzyme PQQ synthesis protein D (PqqD)